MKVLIATALIWSTLAFAQTASSPISGANTDPATAITSPAVSHDDPNWTLAYPTPKEIVLPKPIPGNNCQNRYHPSSAKPVDMSEIGSTILELHVMPDGSIQDIKIDQTSNIPELDDAALSCIKNSWRYTPATYEGQPVEVTRKVRINWGEKH
ncbi:MAG: TonB family protein [Rhizomicrobium sp.]